MNVKQFIALCVGCLLAGLLWLTPTSSHARAGGSHTPSHFDYSFDFSFGPREFYIAAVAVLTVIALVALRDRRSRLSPPAV